MGFDFEEEQRRREMGTGTAGAAGAKAAPTAALQRKAGNKAVGMLMRKEAEAAAEAKTAGGPEVGSSGLRMEIVGKKTGKVEGDLKDGKIEIYTYKQTSQSPRDNQSGMASGAARHKPAHITKSLDDKAAVQLFQIHSNNEELEKCIVEVVKRDDKTGAMTVTRTIDLSGAFIEELSDEMGEKEAQSLLINFREMEKTNKTKGVTAKGGNAGATTK
jgi:type VI secretion system Hcp family effector